MGNPSYIVSKIVCIITAPSPTFQRTGKNLPKLNATFYSQIKGDESSKIAFRPSK